jgi:hypothetical protein
MLCFCTTYLEQGSDLGQQWIESLKLNRGGLILCGVYSAISLPLFALADFGFADNVKGQFVFKELAVAPAMALLTYTHLIGPLLEACPWMNSFPVFFALNLAIAYLVGWGFSRLAT